MPSRVAKNCRCSSNMEAWESGLIRLFRKQEGLQRLQAFESLRFLHLESSKARGRESETRFGIQDAQSGTRKDLNCLN